MFKCIGGHLTNILISSTALYHYASPISNMHLATNELEKIYCFKIVYRYQRNTVNHISPAIIDEQKHFTLINPVIFKTRLARHIIQAKILTEATFCINECHFVYNIRRASYEYNQYNSVPICVQSNLPSDEENIIKFTIDLLYHIYLGYFSVTFC